MTQPLPSVYRFSQPQNAIQMRQCFQQCSDRHHISAIVFNHHQSAISDDISFGDANSPKIRIDDASIANSRWITQNILSRRTNREYPINIDFLRKIVD